MKAPFLFQGLIIVEGITSKESVILLCLESFEGSEEIQAIENVGNCFLVDI